jgi:hypothetical protein
VVYRCLNVWAAAAVSARFLCTPFSPPPSTTIVHLCRPLSTSPFTSIVAPPFKQPLMILFQSLPFLSPRSLVAFFLALFVTKVMAIEANTRLVSTCVDYPPAGNCSTLLLIAKCNSYKCCFWQYSTNQCLPTSLQTFPPTYAPNYPTTTTTPSSSPT